MKKADLLKEALHIVEKRGLSYGKPENNFARIAQLWDVFFRLREKQPCTSPTGEEPYVDETDVAILMVLIKVGRLMETPNHLDSWQDIAGYAACGAEVSKAGEDTDLAKAAVEEVNKLVLNAETFLRDSASEFERKFPLDRGRDSMIYGMSVANVTEDGAKRVDPKDLFVGLTQGDPGDETGPTDELAPAIHVQHQVRPLKVGDDVVSKLPFEATWCGTVLEVKSNSNRPFALVEWRVASAVGSTPWRRWVDTETLEHAAVKS